MTMTVFRCRSRYSEQCLVFSECAQPLTRPVNPSSVESIDHGWLFPQIDVAVHHGG